MSPAKKVKKGRQPGFGTVRKLPSGNLQASYIGPDGKRHNAASTFANVGPARDWLASVKAQINMGTWLPPEEAQTKRERENMTFGEYAERWFVTRRKKGQPLRPNTQQTYRTHLDKRLAVFADKRLVAIDRAMVRDWHNEQIATGHISQATAAYKLLSLILGEAVEDELIPANPCRIKGARSARTGREVEPPTRDELAKLVEVIDPRYKAMVQIMAWGGLRFGEVAELRRKDFTITRDADGAVSVIEVTIARAMVHVTKTPDILPRDVKLCPCKPGCTVGPPKSEDGKRTIALPPHVFGDVLDHLDNRTGKFGNSLLFVASTGDQRHLTQPLFWWPWNEARKKAGRSDLSVHSLRHFAGTRHQEAGATLKDTMSFLGHSTPGTAMGYQHETGRRVELAMRMA
ncbi:tyrosine-type recombinase/integrase [Microbacterium lacticum]|uniref:tyrosine-type recombinase/integrase n=1 Tax=Microbacterium lacticum TaxID=33885 RepID=UPI0028D638CA|nr:tyrosine-type recombinase/integrase [Microbacterium lacticum]